MNNPIAPHQLSNLVAAAILASAYAVAGAAPGATVCAPGQDAASAMGRAAPQGARAACSQAQRVTAIGADVDVSAVMGNGPRYFNRPSSSGTMLATRDPRGRPVDVLLGRASEPRQTRLDGGPFMPGDVARMDQ